MTTEMIIVVTILFASFVRGVSGFGAALIAMPVLSGFTSVYEAAPLVALIGLSNDTLLGAYYRRSFDWAVVSQLLVGSVLGIPLGFWVLRFAPEGGMLSALGLALVAYALYALLSPAMPALKSRRWIYGTGFVSGILNGSYNLPGPPVILYGNSQGWSQEKFKGTLSSFLWGNAVLIVLGHGIQHRFSALILQQYLIAMPSLFVGTFVGIALSKSFDPLMFRRVVLFILVVIGLRLVALGMQL
ncbi:MAG: sulfite exporter TauE/SafE family protein [Cyanobacteria bacterium J06627_28]